MNIGDDQRKYHHRWYDNITASSILFYLLLGSAVIMSSVALYRTHDQSFTHHPPHPYSLNGGGGNGIGKNTISVQSLISDSQPRTIYLCSEEHYYSNGGGSSENLTLLDATIEELQREPLRSAYHYLLYLNLRIEFNTDMSQLFSSQSNLDALNKYMRFDYNITTNYPYITTVRLIETEFHPYEALFRQPRELILCSNTQLANTPRCDQYADSKIITIHSQKWRPISQLDRSTTTNKMDRPPQQRGAINPSVTTPKSPTSSTMPSMRQEGRGGLNDADFYDMISSNENSLTYNEEQKQSILGVRVYNVIFYRKAIINEDNQFISRNTGYSREESFLTVKLRQC